MKLYSISFDGDISEPCRPAFYLEARAQKLWERAKVKFDWRGSSLDKKDSHTCARSARYERNAHNASVAHDRAYTCAAGAGY